MASGDTLLTFVPAGALVEVSKSGSGTLDARNNHPVVDLALTETCRFEGVMPRHYDGGGGTPIGVTVYLHYAMSTATGNDIKLETAFERIGDQQQDIGVDGFATAQPTGDVPVPATSGLVDIVTTTHTNGTQMDSVAGGEAFRLQVTRVAVTGTDATGDLELLAVEVKET